MPLFKNKGSASKINLDEHKSIILGSSMATAQVMTLESLQEFHRQHFPDVSAPGVDLDSDVVLGEPPYATDETSLDHYADGQARYLTEEQIEYLRYREIKAVLEGKTLDEALNLEEEKSKKQSSNDVVVETTNQPKKKKRRRNNKRGYVTDHETPNDVDHTPNRLARELDESQHNDVYLDY